MKERAFRRVAPSPEAGEGLRRPWRVGAAHQADQLGLTTPGHEGHSAATRPSLLGGVRWWWPSPCGVTSVFLSLTSPAAPSVVGSGAHVRSCAGKQMLCLGAGTSQGEGGAVRPSEAALSCTPAFTDGVTSLGAAVHIYNA